MLLTRVGGVYGSLIVASTITWNPSDKDAGITLSGGNLTTTNNTGSAFSAVRGTGSGHSTGKFYYEITAITQTFAAFSHFGVANASANLATFLGGDTNSAVMSGSGSTACNGLSMGGTGDGLGSGQLMGIAADFTAKKVWFWNSGGNRWNGDILANQNPSTGTGGFDMSALAAGPYFPALDIWQLNDSFTANFGATAYSITVPTGFGNW